MDYQNGKVYKIESNMGDKIYVGSTTKHYLSERMTAHRRSYKCWKNSRIGYLKSFDMFDEYGLENCNIILLELCPCNSKDELRARERHYITQLNCINKNVPNRTLGDIKEYNNNYVKEHKEKIEEYSRKYREANKERSREKIKCVCGCDYARKNKSQHEKTKAHLSYVQN